MRRKINPKNSIDVPNDSITNIHVENCCEQDRRGILKKSLIGHPNPKSVSFKNISIREYVRIVGDNPSCSNGSPVSIGWIYGNTAVTTVDQYEGNRPIRRNSFQMVIPQRIRQEMLMEEWGFSRADLASATRKVTKCKNQRRQTVNNLYLSKIEEIWETTFKTLRRLVFRTKRSSWLYLSSKQNTRQLRSNCHDSFEKLKLSESSRTGKYK
mmetsp:Transcript_5691/g.8253  ORF Transcript_5691/g.8253 Transcript_5691/m.8253 type:complete len:211 (-) Transcript_5691:274-906(-)